MRSDQERRRDTAESMVMPRVVKLRGRTPQKVLDAVEVFGSEVRVRLIRHYLEHPGSQSAAAEALGQGSGLITRHTQRLIRLGVVRASLDPTNNSSRIYNVRLDRYRQLVQALLDYVDVEGEKQ